MTVDPIRFSHERVTDQSAIWPTYRPHAKFVWFVQERQSIIRTLAAQGHTFVCHTMSHTSNDLADAILTEEIVGAVARMAAELQQQVTAFVWLRGPEWGVEPHADHLLQQAGIHLLISNFKIQRIATN